MLGSRSPQDSGRDTPRLGHSHIKVNLPNAVCFPKLLSVPLYYRGDPQVPLFSQGETDKVAEWEANR